MVRRIKIIHRDVIFTEDPDYIAWVRSFGMSDIQIYIEHEQTRVSICRLKRRMNWRFNHE